MNHSLFVDHLCSLDVSLLDPEFGLIGNSYHVNIHLSGPLDNQGMILDFSEVKREIKRLIDLSADHTLLIPKKSRNLEVMDRVHEVYIKYYFKNRIQSLTLQAPEDSVTWLESTDITTPLIADYLVKFVQNHWPYSHLSLNITLEEEQIKGASYCYSHGLRQHLGNCQRIAHGHRSKIEIKRNGSRDHQMEEYWAAKWSGKFIGTHANIEKVTTNAISFAYQSSQGCFKLTVPNNVCYMIDEETTIEQLANHIAQQLKNEYPQDIWSVRAFEGINKGAERLL